MRLNEPKHPAIGCMELNMKLTRYEIVGMLVEEYKANGQAAAIALFNTLIKKYEMSQLGIKSTIIDFRKAIESI